MNPSENLREREAVREVVRAQYGRHPIVHAPDGGCKHCPLGADDLIHTASSGVNRGRIVGVDVREATRG